ncbi:MULTISPECIES: DUF1496 domain-containing protein [Vibrio]|uniref:DUF1496 domain-containing protein n=1 Tax=Vibrio TaxID=662 RepID=UPI0001B954C7|nr:MULTISPECIES: DUF1496 domain-containing protein [Vibrio]AXN30967.1 DUF1496 domain-containing protein [Vibrio coralliilyticus]EEX31590.1 hypothetical protein VIC_004540 [Vibrio coralliilyticus ATCC BAA-450]KFI13723.1 hypothetical protein IX95_00520 [Vibrio sp. B183]KPH27348.1 hypothetical protein ADU60_03545 [Vibrio coralliilyticus]MCM5506744.1 DUF1496 domain-containing protein [Vibrio sp. SCSIO 43169]
MRINLYTLLLLASVSASANVITTPGKAVIAIDGSEAAKRVCYYQDQGYSLGAILQVGEHYMICTEANDFETNGALKWAPLNSQTQVEPKESNPKVKSYSIK